MIARVQNLSTAGVYVTATASELPAAGTEVLCRMLVGGERCTFKGLVAWVRAEGADGAGHEGPGAGIQFVDVTAREAELLARLIQPDTSDRQSVDVWFEGMGAPIKSHATITDDALSISTKLPFLRLNSPVKVSFVRRGVEEVRSGILEAVTLEPSAEDGIPRLQVTVSTPLPDSAYGTIDVPSAPVGFTPPPEGLLVREPPLTMIAPATLTETPPPEPIDQAQVPTPPPVLAPRVTEQDRTLRMVRPSESALATVPPVPVAVAAPLPRHTSLATRVAMALVTAGVAGALGYVLVNRYSTPAALVETTVPVAAPGATRGRDKAEPGRAPAARAEAERKPAPLALPAAASLSETPPREALADKEKAREKAAPEPAAPPPAPVEPPAVAITIIGSSRGMQFYKLADPPGLAINLPYGYPRPGTASRLAGGPIVKRVAVQRKGAGSHLRVYFTNDQNADVSVEASGLRVTLKARPKRAGRKPK